jgi:hypothetical protein
MEKFNVKKLNDVEVKGQYCVEISDRSSSLETLDMKWMLIYIWKLLKRISKFLPKRVSVIIS